MELPTGPAPKLQVSIKKGSFVIKVPTEPLNAMARALTLMQTAEFAELVNRVARTGDDEEMVIPVYPWLGY